MPKQKTSIALGVTGSIAAYKAADLTSLLVKQGIDVTVLMTASAKKLIQPQTFLTLSHNPVISELWDIPTWQPEHIALAERSNLFVVAPATANFLAKLAHGIADDALTTFALAHTGKIIVAPAMNPRMWNNPATQNNCQILQKRGIIIVEPDSGHVACGSNGKGRLAELQKIETTILTHLNPPPKLSTPKQPQPRILITAGATREFIDPVRFLTNRSTGKMGYALAQAAVEAGCQTTLISAPTNLPTLAGTKQINITTADQMATVVKQQFAKHDILIMTAAVADYRPINYSKHKIKKDDKQLNLQLERTEDIIATVAKTKTQKQKIMGFAAETENLKTNAQQKLKLKKLDWIVANDVSRTDIAFAADHNQVIVISNNGIKEIPKMSKLELAKKLIKIVCSQKDENEKNNG